MIEAVVSYHFDGKHFDSPKAVKLHVENEIGRVIDSTPNRLPSSFRLAVFDQVVKGRRRLIELLSAEFYEDPDEIQSGLKSIFDL